MNFCQKHWDELREIIDKFGLSKFVASSGQMVAEHIERELKGESTIIDFDPLMSASIAMASKAMQYMGLRMMMADESGKPPCPACSMERYHWVEACAYQSALEAMRRGLITEDQLSAINGQCIVVRPSPPPDEPEDFGSR